MLLYPTPRATRVILEHPGVDAVDDVVVYYATPGENEGGRRFEVDFYQLKYHVTQGGGVDHEMLIDPAQTGTRASMLRRFSDAWKQIRRQHPAARLTLVTNWPWAPSCPLAKLIRGDSRRLGEAFFTATKRQKVGKIRDRWKRETGLSDSDFGEFARALRFSTSAPSQAEAEDWLRDRCQAVGLVPPPVDRDYSPYDDLGQRLLERGHCEFTPESLRRLVEEQGLVATKSPPFDSTFALRSFVRPAWDARVDGACLVDLTELFKGRHPRYGDAWTQVQRRIDAALPQLRGLGQPVQIALDVHLSIAWFLGLRLARAGLRTVLRQLVPQRGVELWGPSVAERPDQVEDRWLAPEVETPHAGARELAVVVSVTHNTWQRALEYVRGALPAVGQAIHLGLPAPSRGAVRGAGHARWLVDELVRQLMPYLRGAGPPHLHLFLAGPVSLAFLLGQASQGFGPTTVYEYDFEGSRSYSPGMSSVSVGPSHEAGPAY